MALFKIGKTDHFWQKVKFTEIDGETETAIEGEFKFLKPSKKKIREVSDPDSGYDDERFMREIVLGWRNFRNIDGQEIPCTEEERKAIADHPTAVRALAEAWVEGINGVRKNS